jgi:hypothetical protein
LADTACSKDKSPPGSALLTGRPQRRALRTVAPNAHHGVFGAFKNAQHNVRCISNRFLNKNVIFVFVVWTPVVYLYQAAVKTEKLYILFVVWTPVIYLYQAALKTEKLFMFFVV